MLNRHCQRCTHDGQLGGTIGTGMLSIAVLEMCLAGSSPNLASTNITPLGTLLGTTNLLKLLEQHTDFMPVQESADHRRQQEGVRGLEFG